MIEKSFFIIRTNPALTGNVKLVISSNYNLYLESFNANETLRKQRFKHFLIKNDEYWKEVLSDFFDGVENKTIFEVENLNDISETYTDFKFQFDDTYFSGAQFVEDNWYSEEYEYTAPLYLKTSKLPTDFIILRLDGLGSLTEDTNSSNFRERFINNWKFVTSFDLTENSNLGKWIKKNFINDISFPQFPMIINHGDIDLSQLSGIDILKSGWSTKYINLIETQSKNSPIFRSEEYFTKLWENNSLIYPHIINFKFLFDDTPATPTSLRKYSINRYIGFYVDEKIKINSISPFKGFDLNIVDISNIEGLDEIEASQIPYLRENVFIREINGRFYSFNPIKNGWKDNQTYWIEWKQNYYRLEKIVNNVSDIFQSNVIIGDFIYRVVSTINIERDINDFKNIDGLDDNFVNSLSPDDLKILKKVTINDLGNDYISGTTYKSRIVINSNNIIENSNNTLILFKRNYTFKIIDGVSKLLFKLEITEQDNTFNIQNYDEADLHLLQINNDYYVIRKYPSNTPNFANKYYLQTDWNLNINNIQISAWINNGNINKDPLFYKNTNIETIKSDENIPFFNILRINFTDIKDFDFDRIESNYTRYEYEKKYELKDNIEPKFYAKEFGGTPLVLSTLKYNKARRLPILDENNRPLNLRDQRGEINPFTNEPYTDIELYYRDSDNSWQLFEGFKDGSNWSKYLITDINLSREFYREENYIWRFEDNNENLLGLIDFRPNSDKEKILEELTWGITNKSEISDIKKPLPYIKSVDPNQQIDLNYVPVSSEYINSDELWELRNNELTSIWDKNQSICKWGYLNSNGAHDYPYRLNYSLEFGIYNKEPNPNTNRNFPIRSDQNLDYFYKFNLLNKEQYQYYTLHTNSDFFDIDAYLSSEYDYFESLFKSDQITSDGIELTYKYSSFFNKNEFSDSETIFRGVKYLLSDVKQIIYDEVERQKTGKLIIDDILTTPNINYNDYKFSIIFGKKKSNFNNEFIKGSGNSNMGVDIYLNDYWKNVIIHLYINTDEIIQLTNPDNNQFINAETSEIDFWYKDINDTKDNNPILWNNLEFKINNFGINLRPRDFKLLDIINLIKNKNFNPQGLVNKEKINFIHIYNTLDVNNNPLVKVMDWSNTDFVLDILLPEEILIKEKSFITNTITQIPKFTINNSLENRKITSDSNNSDFTLEGLQVDSINDINTYNNYPIAKSIDENLVDIRFSWQLDDTTDPSIFRYNGVFVPIFKFVSLFRPLLYKELRDNNKTPILKNGNFKFYDINSSLTLPNLTGFGIIEELIFSKCNNNTSILKIQDPTKKEKSIYPMVDEYGYDFDARFIFSANFEPSFNYISKKIEVPVNDKKTLAGFTIHYDGVKEYLRIPDTEKFNQEKYLVDDVNYNNFIINEPTGERRFFNFNILNLNNNNKVFTKVIKIVKGIDYKLNFNYLNYPIIGTPPPNRSNVYVNFEFNFVSINGNKTLATIKDYIFNPFSNPVVNHDYLSTIINILSINTDSLNLSSDYLDFNTYNLEIKITLNTIFNSNSDKLDISCESSITSLVGINILDIETGNYYLENNTNNELGDILFGSFIKLNSEVKDIINYPAFSKVSLSSKFTQHELDTYDTSINNVWREFSGISTNKRPGRVGILPYDYNNFQIPKNWDGLIYIDILNNLRTGCGNELKNQIINFGQYGYTSYANAGGTLNNYIKKAFDLSTIYHFLEYGSQNPLPNTNNNDLSFQNSRFGTFIILNEFYKITGFQNFFNRGFATSFSYNNKFEFMRISNDISFSFEPDRDTHLIDGGKAVFIGETFGTLTKPFNTFQWYPQFRDTRLELNIIPKNGNIISISVPLIDPSTGVNFNFEDVKNLINNELTTSVYNVELIISNNIGNYKIISSLDGSYYNFDILLKTTKDFKFIISQYSSDIKMISEKFTKTSLRENRRTGRINSLTIEFWIKVDAWERDYETILYKGEDKGNDVWDDKFTNFTYIISKLSNSDKIAFKTCHEQLLGDYKTHTLSSDLEINDGNWHHLCFVMDFNLKTKSIYLDGILDRHVVDFLEPVDSSGNIIDITPEESELLAQFIERRNRFIPGLQHPNIGVDTTLANKIRIGSQDSNTIYWSQVIRGLIEPTFSDLDWQHKNWSTTITIAFETFQQNYKNLNYYLRVNSDIMDWDILIGTDSTIKNGNRNFEGFIDELRIWNYARTEEQISHNYRFIVRPESYLDPLNSLVAYYRFDEGQGFNKVNDLMNGHTVKSLDKWCRVRETFINDGRKEKEIEEISFFNFVNSFYIGDNILIDDELTDWDISGATILGISDERSIPRSPEPVLIETIREIEPPIFNRSKFTLIKRRMKRLIFNTKETILNLTTTRTFQFRPVKWWLFKTLESRIVEDNQSSTVRFRIEREGKTWLNQIANLITKRRR